MLWFYLVSLVVNLAVCAGFMFRYRQTSAKAYLHIGLAVLANAVAAGLLAFLGDMIFDNYIIALAVIYASAIVGSVAGLVMVMVILGLLRTWIASMRASVHLRADKADKAERVCRLLRLAYPALTAVSIVFYVLLIVSLGFAAALALVVGLAFSVCVCAQCAIIVWMWLDLRATAGNESEVRKRNQLVKLGALTFFGAWPAMFAGVGVGTGGAVVWWVWFGIALWPGVLIGFEDPVQPAGVGAGAGAGAYAAGAGDYKYEASAASAGMYNAPAPAPPAAYQPQYQQQYGGQAPQQYGNNGYAAGHYQ